MQRAGSSAPALAGLTEPGARSHGPAAERGESTPPRPPTARGWPPLWHVALLLGLALALWLPRLQGPIDLRHDAGVYYTLGTSLATGQGYRLLYEPGDPQAVQYPPLLPGFVALHQWAAGSAELAEAAWLLRLSFAGIFVLFVLAAYVLARRSLGDGPALLVGLLAELNLYSWYMSDLLFTEVPYALLGVLFVLAGERARGWRGEALTGSLAVAAYLLRTAALALLAAWVLEALVRRRWRRAAIRAAVALVPVLGWQGYVAHVQATPEYQEPAYAYQRAPYMYHNVPYGENALLVAPFAPEEGTLTPAAFAGRVAAGVAAMPQSVGGAVSAEEKWCVGLLERVQYKLGLSTAVPVPRGVLVFLLALLGGVTLAGVARWARAGRWLLLLTVGLSIGLVCTTPWPEQFGRYLSPLAPFLALALVEALVRLSRFTRARWRGLARHAGPAALALAATAALGVQAATIVRSYRWHAEAPPSYPFKGGEVSRRVFWYDHTWRQLDAAMAWLSWHAAPDEVVATAFPQRAYLYAGLDAVMPPMEDDPAEAQRLLDTVPAAWLVIDQIDWPDVSRRYGRPVVDAFPGRWRLAYQTPDGGARVYERVDGRPARRTTAAVPPSDAPSHEED